MACREVGKDKLRSEPEQSGKVLELAVVRRDERVERPTVERLSASQSSVS
jgi:hypothetical protein